MIVTLIEREVHLKGLEASRYKIYNELKDIAAALKSTYSLVRIDEEDSKNEVHIYCDFKRKEGNR